MSLWEIKQTKFLVRYRCKCNWVHSQKERQIDYRVIESHKPYTFGTGFHCSNFKFLTQNEKNDYLQFKRVWWLGHGFQNRTGSRGRTMKIGNQDEIRFFKPNEPDFLLIPWTVKTGVGPHKPVRTMRSNPLAIKKKKTT